MLKEFNAGVVIHDMSNSATPLQTFDCDTIYLRFHGTEKNYKGTYSGDSLSYYEELIKRWHKQKKKVYVYFNNTLGGAVSNVASLNKMLGI